MKLILLLLLPLPAFACPNLVGQWQCHDGGEKFALTTFDESAIPNGVLYAETTGNASTKIYADGITRPIVQKGATGSQTASCQDDAVMDDIRVESIPVNSTSETIHQHIEMQSATSYIDTFYIVGVYDGQAPKDRKETVYCTRVP